MTRSPYFTPLVLAAACITVGILAALGTFNSIFNFPLVFALVCLAVFLLTVLRERPRQALVARAAIVLVGAAVAAGGWLFQARVAQGRLAEMRLEALAALEGRTLPSLAGLEPLNTEPEAWDEAASLTAKATIVAFWARWCSPCWKEMPELEELYREHRDRGLRVVAVTRYDRPEDEAERQSDFTKAQEFLRSYDLTYPAAITDREDIFEAFLVRGLPSTALVDERGRIVDYAAGLPDSRALMVRAAALATGATGASGG